MSQTQYQLSLARFDTQLFVVVVWFCVVLCWLLCSPRQVLFSGLAVDLFGAENAPKAISLTGVGYGAAGFLGPILYTSTDRTTHRAHQHHVFFLVSAAVSVAAFVAALSLRYCVLKPPSHKSVPHGDVARSTSQMLSDAQIVRSSSARALAGR